MKDTVTIFSESPRWVFMWGLVAALFFAGKAAVWASASARPAGWRGAGWWLLWPGMDAEAFAVKHLKPSEATRTRLVFSALTNMVFGGTLLWLVARVFDAPLVKGWVGMIGLVFGLHFGVMHLLAVFWQRNGVSAMAVMKNPAASMSLSEFWGRRWNIAFRDLAHRFVFRPVAHRWGRGAGLWMTFLVSGLAHELVISVPAGAGLGFPSLYFLLQALGITLERKLPKPRHLIVKSVFTHFFTLLPLGLLFHPPFVLRVMLPFFHAIGALP